MLDNAVLYMCACVCVKSLSCVRLFAPCGLQLAKLLCPWDAPARILEGAIYPSLTRPCSRQYFKQRTNAVSVAFNDTHVHTLFRAVSNLSFKPPLCQRLPPPKVCSQDRRQLPLCPCRWYPAAWSWGRPQHTTWQAPWRT